VLQLIMNIVSHRSILSLFCCFTEVYVADIVVSVLFVV